MKRDDDIKLLRSAFKFKIPWEILRHTLEGEFFLPYPVCAFAINHPQIEKEVWTLVQLTHNDNVNYRFMQANQTLFERELYRVDGGWNLASEWVSPLVPLSAKVEDTFKDITFWVLAAISYLNTHNETILVSETAKAMKLGEPLRLWKETWTLQLDLPTSTDRKQYGGGTHASPAEHLRRGHWRKRNGKLSWVRDTIVCEGKLRSVEKDYEICR